MNDRHLEAARLRDTGLTYSEIAARLGYAGRDGARNAVMIANKANSHNEPTPELDDVRYFRRSLSNICPRCGASGLLTVWGETCCIQCGYYPYEKTLPLVEVRGQVRLPGEG